MANVLGQLVWEIVKKNNSFLVNEFGRGTHSVQFSKESNKKTITIQPAGKDQSVLLATTKTEKQNKPAALLHKSVMKKELRMMAKVVENQAVRISGRK
ncbi:hypothetical protein K1719_034127 [Acacia pycnantha]|nr:hypothetical protein K1719_034127 [Acacia pycnantha]